MAKLRKKNPLVWVITTTPPFKYFYIKF
ncbi:hypothetical protein MIMGU_mgv1a0254692mg, partial [Erythranthe guttata]